jgi:RND family efflux transporter MFP subunit
MSIAFGADGRVDELNFSAGDMVQEGDLIAKYDNLKTLERDTTLREIAVRRAEIGVERAQLYLDLTLENRYAKDSDIQLKEWDLELAQLSYQELMISLGEQLASVEAAKLIAPMDGMVIDSKVRVNQIFSANDEVMTIADVSNLAVLVDSYTVNAEELKEGMSVVLEVYNSSETYTGTIQQIPYPYGTGPARDIDKYIYIYFDDPEDAEGWKINDRFDITAEITRVEDILWLPPKAIREFSGRTFVMVEEGDKQVSIDIKLGLTNGEMTEIVEGLEEGQVIIGQ